MKADIILQRFIFHADNFSNTVSNTLRLNLILLRRKNVCIFKISKNVHQLQKMHKDANISPQGQKKNYRSISTEIIATKNKTVKKSTIYAKFEKNSKNDQKFFIKRRRVK